MEGALGNDDVEVTYEKAEYATQYVGSPIPLTVSGIGFAGKDGGNYELEDPDLVMEYEKGRIMRCLLKSRIKLTWQEDIP